MDSKKMTDACAFVSLGFSRVVPIITIDTLDLLFFIEVDALWLLYFIISMVDAFECLNYVVSKISVCKSGKNH